MKEGIINSLILLFYFIIFSIYGIADLLGEIGGYAGSITMIGMYLVEFF